MCVAGLYGILEAAGAFDQSSSNEQDSLGANSEVTKVCSLLGTGTTDASDSSNNDNNNGFDIRGDGSLLLRQFINTGDDTVTVQLEYHGIGWIAMAFSESTSMIPNSAIIALPDENIVQKYDLSSKSLPGVTPLDTTFQTLIDTSVTQVDGMTVMTFTKPLIESGEVTVVPGKNQFNWAVGSSNSLSYHANRGSASLKFDLCFNDQD
jgi:hypothetical protein